MKKVNINILRGNSNNQSLISEKLSSSELNHAYIIEGDEGFGKRTLAREIIKAFACEAEIAPCGRCDSCLKISSGSCVDVYTVKRPPGKVYIPVDLIRELYETVYLMSNDLPFKVYIFEDAEYILPPAQNAFLKLLEEPPENVYFFILCKSVAHLLPTIRSRAQLISLKPLADGEITDILVGDGIPRDRAAVIAKLSSGSLGRARSIATGDTEPMRNREQARELAALLLGGGDGGKFEFVSLHHKYFKKHDDFFAVYALLYSALRDIMIMKQDCSAPLLFFTDEAEAEDMANGADGLSVLEMCAVIDDAFSYERVVTRLPLMLTEFSSRLWQCKYRI